MSPSSGSSPVPSPSPSPLRPPRASGRVQLAAEAIQTGNGNGARAMNPQKQLALSEVEQLNEARRVEALRLHTTDLPSPLRSSNSSPRPRSPQPQQQHGVHLAVAVAVAESTPAAATRARPRTLSQSQSPATQLALAFRGMSLHDDARAQEATATATATTADSHAARASPTPLSTAGRRNSRDELTLLVVSASMTELAMSIQEAETLIFEIQELRHTTSAPPARPSGLIVPADPPPVPLADGSEVSTSSQAVAAEDDARPPDKGPSEEQMTEVDQALMRLDAKLEEVRKEFATVEAQMNPLFDSSDDADSAAFLRRKWLETCAGWEAIQKDAEMLNDELKEDKWLTVFRTVSQQAEDMMTSLEKVLKQSHEFIWDLNRRQATSGTLAQSTSERSLASLASSEQSTSSSYFGDPVSMQPLLSSFVALHRSLHAKIKYYSPACDRVLKILGKGIADRSTKNGEVLRRFGEMKQRWRNLLERIGRIESEMRGVEEMLREAAASSTESPKGNGNGNGNGTGTGKSNGKASPFRRLANKMSSSRSSPQSLSASAASSPASTPTRATMPRPAVPSSRTTPVSPPRPPRSEMRPASSLAMHAVPPPSYSTTPSRPPQTSGHRSTRSAAGFHGSGTGATLTPPPRSSRRAPSPAPSNDGTSLSKPRWNISTKRDEKEVLRDSASRPSGRASAMGLRSASRMSLARSVNDPGRASPAFSNFSDASGYARERPSTPSRIPIPSSAGGSRYARSSTPFSSLEDPQPSSIHQRSFTPTPTPAASRLPLTASQRAGLSASTSSTTTTRSHIPTPASLRAPSPAFSQASSFAGGTLYHRGSSQTPEPHLVAASARLSHQIKGLPYARPPPVPSLPSSHRSTGPRRPPSRAILNPPPTAEPGAYRANPADPLDVAVVATLESLATLLRVERLDAPLARDAPMVGSGMSAKYAITAADSPRRSGQGAVVCKLVDRVGPRAEKGQKKVLVRVGTGWMELELWALQLLATGL